MQVEGFTQAGAQLFAQAMILCQFADGIEPRLDGTALGERRHDPVLQHAGAHRRGGAVEDLQKRPVAVPLAQGPRQFQAAAGDLVDEEKVAAAVGANALEVGQARLQCLLQIEQQGAGRHDTRLFVIEAEAGQGAHVEVPKQGRPRRGGIERPVGPPARRHAGMVSLQRAEEDLGYTLRAQAFGSGQPPELVRQSLARHICRQKLSGG